MHQSIYTESDESCQDNYVMFNEGTHCTGTGSRLQFIILILLNCCLNEYLCKVLSQNSEIPFLMMSPLRRVLKCKDIRIHGNLTEPTISSIYLLIFQNATRFEY